MKGVDLITHIYSAATPNRHSSTSSPLFILLAVSRKLKYKESS